MHWNCVLSHYCVGLFNYSFLTKDLTLPKVRASTGSAEYLVRVPEQAHAGDSFVFRVTEQDIALSSNNDPSNDPDTSVQQHIIEDTVLDPKKTWRQRAYDLVPLFRYELETQVLCDPRRVVLLSAALAVAVCSGFILGSLFVTSDLYCPQCGTSAARNMLTVNEV